ncbi:phosphoglycerate dehydrogenase [Limibacillus halophilus]|uniref:D-3-phosphoglycerate dehydrogenase n=1 Tax=Limibacillus halophilus TaxID=1579333 RepID=A0A839SST7_9PROT|nr:phosphoglycerate dehydrogenase [Limibacillus halophilus]MBB3064780.1 D-3-phosphoglycerate dehydrogenase [Limibacillus halophilus]
MPKVLISDKMSPLAAEIFEARGIETVVATDLTPAALKEKIAAFDGLAVRSATKATAEIIAAGTNLKVIGRAGIGVDNVDIAAATGRGIVVMNTPDGNSITTAEHALALLFTLARQIAEANSSTKAGKWEKSRFMGVELTGKTIGIVGCGNIGSIVAERALGLRMKVVAYDPFLSNERADDLGVRKVELDELLGAADFITLHVPLTEQTRGILNEESLAKTKPGVRIINCARGGLVDEAALYNAIQSGQVAGAALDVFETEPARESPLFGLEQVVCTPHLGASTSEAQEKVALQIAEQMADFLLTGAVRNALNTPSLSAEDAKRLKPYMQLAEQMGSFAGQLTRTGLTSVNIEYEGHVAELNCRPLTQTVLTGLLRPMLDSVNMVNAPVLARERDIALSETKRDGDCDYQTLIRVTVKTDRGQRSVAGTLFGGTKPRVVEIKGIQVEAELGPHMLYITNKDKPGLIGRLGTILSDAGVNIATFHLGRSSPGGDAIALLELDQSLSAETLKKVRALDLVERAEPLSFQPLL